MREFAVLTAWRQVQKAADQRDDGDDRDDDDVLWALVAS